jgi:hypothetical protein
MRYAVILAARIVILLVVAAAGHASLCSFMAHRGWQHPVLRQHLCGLTPQTPGDRAALLASESFSIESGRAVLLRSDGIELEGALVQFVVAIDVPSNHARRPPDAFVVRYQQHFSSKDLLE